MSSPELSIIIPTLNEAEHLPLLLADLQQQTGLCFEVIVTDGGSTDATCTIAKTHFSSSQLTGRCVTGPKGRGRQLNAGVGVASADWYLFLHADSRLVDASQLCKAMDFIKLRQERQPLHLLAGRFKLKFNSCDAEDGFGFFFYEAKARLGRPGCIHGDQGMLISKAGFGRVGPFREDLPVMEDTFLADKIHTCGEWLLLPGVIRTSARRFQVEGFKTRQTLNALMMNFLAIGWLDFFDHVPDLYQQQDRTRTLKLLPFFKLIRDLLARMPIRQRLRIWHATGRYVRSQAWQIGFAMDCRKAYRRGGSLTGPASPWLDWFDRWFDPLTNHCLGYAMTALLVRAWFSSQLTCR